MNETQKFRNHYVEWNKVRIAKIESIVGKDFFKGKSVLELACGYGFIGKHFRENLGADVTFAEGRAEHISHIEKNNPGARVILLNQEYDWILDRRFDVVIHFGLTYHLINWRQDLRCAMEHTSLMFYETEVTDSLNPRHIRRFIEPRKNFDQALNDLKVGTRPSPAYIEAEVVRNGWTFNRYDDPALNTGKHKYDWPAQGLSDKISDEDYKPEAEMALRRFWVLRGQD